MTAVDLNTYICVGVVAFACIGFIPIFVQLFLHIQRSHEPQSFVNKIVLCLTSTSFISYFIGSLLILISFILSLQSNDPYASHSCQQCRSARGLSTACSGLGKSTLMLVLITRLANSFARTIHRLSKCLVHFLYTQIICVALLRFSITAFIISDTFFNVAMLFGFLIVLVDAIVFSITVYLFCNKLQSLLLSEAYSCASQVDLDLVKVMTRYSFLVICIVVNHVALISQAFIFSSMAPKNEIFYTYTFSAFHELLNTFFLFLTFKFASTTYQKVFGFGDKKLEQCCVCCINKRQQQRKAQTKSTTNGADHQDTDDTDTDSLPDPSKDETDAFV
eukprot:267975_1